jgi:integrase
MAQIFKRGKKYAIAYTDERGKRIRQVVASDKSVAQKILGDRLAAVERLKAGVLHVDPREAKRSLGAVLDDYIADLERRGRDSMYCYIVRKHIEAAVDEQGWQRLLDITPRSVSSFLRTLSGRKLAPKTVNDYRADIAAFLGWCVREGRLEANACDQVPKTTVKAEKKRRALSVAECRALIAAAPPERAAAYRFLMFTGLRRAEADSIRWMHVRMDVANPYVELPASITKSGRAETVPLVPELVAALAAQRGDAKERDPVFPDIPSMYLFRKDLAVAGIEEEDARGRRVVLHSLRHSLATMLAVSGVPMAYAQRIMRHRDIRLTSEVYQDEALLPLSAAMLALPSMSSEQDEAGPQPAPAQHALGMARQGCAKNVPSMRHNRAVPGTAGEGELVARAS